MSTIFIFQITYYYVYSVFNDMHFQDLILYFSFGMVSEDVYAKKLTFQFPLTHLEEPF